LVASFDIRLRHGLIPTLIKIVSNKHKKQKKRQEKKKQLKQT
jgi:hypothetical protein